MAIAIVQATAEKAEAITEHYTHGAWERSNLPPPLTHRLTRVDSCILGMIAINRLLMADSIGKEDVSDNDGVTFAGALAPMNVDGLRLALQELGSSAAAHMDELREIKISYDKAPQ